MTEKTLTTENIKPAIDALRGELAPWPVVAMKQDKLNDTQKSAVNSGITSGLVAQIIANTAAIRALESAITGTGLRPLVVASLPAVGTQGILYIVPVTTYDPAIDADVVNYSNEYIWIVAPDAPVTQGYYEQVGQTGIVINDGTLTVKANNVSLGTFTANQSGNTDINITIPTNSDYVDLTTDQTAAGVKTFSDGIVGNVTGTASRAVADADGNTISSTYGKLAGSQTWTGSNTILNKDITLKNSDVVLGENPTGNRVAKVLFNDNSNAECQSIQFIQRTDGYTFTQIIAGDKYLNGVKSSSGSLIQGNFIIGVSSEGKAFLSTNNSWRSNLLPYSNSSYGLGSSSLRWSSVYADSYYYGTTAWGLDKENVWTGNNTFTTSYLTLKNSNVTRGTIPNANRNYILSFTDSNNDNVGMIFQQIRSGSGSYKMTFSLNNGTTDHRFNFYGFTNGTSSLMPEVSGVTELGTSTNKWKTLNGINPGALSLPSQTGYVTIDTTNWDLTGADNSYIAPEDGYLFCGSNTCTDVKIYDFTTMLGATSHSSTSKANYTYLPIRKNDNCIVGFVGTSPSVRFYPCLGNV